MTDLAIIAAMSIFTAGLAVSFGAIGPAPGEGAGCRCGHHRHGAAT